MKPDCPATMHTFGAEAGWHDDPFHRCGQGEGHKGDHRCRYAACRRKWKADPLAPPQQRDNDQRQQYGSGGDA